MASRDHDDPRTRTRDERKAQIAADTAHVVPQLIAVTDSIRLSGASQHEARELRRIANDIDAAVAPRTVEEFLAES